MNNQQQQQQRRMSSQPAMMTTTTSSTTSIPNGAADNQAAAEGRASQQAETIAAGAKAETKRPEENKHSSDDEVIPAWPSKQEQLLARNASSEIIQHKVYSLKDYSQVASPTAVSSAAAASSFQSSKSRSTTQPPASAAAATSTSGAGKLLKSMSQDRKVKSSSKRMSECIYPAAGSQVSAAAAASPQSLFGSATKPPSSALSPATATAAAAATPSIGQASSAGLSSSQASGSIHPTSLVGESRIDRMRKLFVSPLSLRSSASGGSASTSSPATSVTALGGDPMSGLLQGNKRDQPRLSLQAATSGSSFATASCKPSAAAHHLMHAMHRSAGPTAAGLAQAMAHHSRRSPMRQKQAKGFRVYGCPLQMANNIYPITCFGRADIYKQQSVPYVLARLCNYIEENSSQLTHEGIFRVSGNARLMEKLRTLFDHLGDAPLESESVDVATSASMLKMYLRELPEPLIPTRMNYYFITLAKKYAPYLSREQASSTSHALQQQQKHHQMKQQAAAAAAAAAAISGGSSKTLASSSTTSISTGATESSSTTATNNSSNNIHNSNNNNSQFVRQRLAFSRDLTKLIRKLPIENYNLLKYLACFLYRISLRQQYNKMCAEALGIVFGPNVFRIRSESYKGLKEQELSNQIMASIISNYKLIFDSELTDPLGNVVDGNENLLMAAVVAVGETIEQQKRKQEQPLAAPTLAPTNRSKTEAATAAGATGADLLAQAERLAQRADRMQATLVPVVVPAAVEAPSASTSDEQPQLSGESVQSLRDSCCPGRCKDFLFDSSGPKTTLRVHHGDDGDDGDDDDDDCDDDEEESYTPSSGTGSYCSSMDSQTLESSYDGEGEIDGRKAGRPGGGDLTSRSTSECASDTSYTPTSSHTDSDVHDDDDDDDEDDDDEDDDESFEDDEQSSVSINNNRLVESQSTGDAIYSGGSQATRGTDCRVCKRRESLQITTIKSTCAASAVAETPAPILISTMIEAAPMVEEANGSGRTEAEESDSQPLRASEDRLAALEGRFQSSLSPKESRRSAQRQPNPLLRRRSSSISSLHGRSIKGDSSRPHRSQRSSGNNSQKKLAALLNSDTLSSGGEFNSKSRTSKQAQQSTGQSISGSGSRKSKACRRQQEHHPWDPKRQSRHSMRTRNAKQAAVDASAGGSNRRSAAGSETGVGRISDVVVRRVAGELELPEAPETISLAAWSEIFTKHLADEAACAAATYEELESDGPARYFLMRSFNSDETLLRSLSYFSDWSNGRRSHELSQAELGLDLDDGGQQQASTMGQQRRRHSNFDFINPDKPAALSSLVRRPCERIFEALDLQETADSSAEQQETEEQEQMPTVPVRPFETSTISLIDNRIGGFRKSELSMNNLSEQTTSASEDAILVQMQATKELIRTIKRLLKLARSRGSFSREMEQLLVKFASSEEGPTCVQAGQSNTAYSDDCLSYYVDHLSARGFMEQLEAAATATTTTVSSDEAGQQDDNSAERLCRILAIKLTLLKQRYNDLKNIRDHYLRYHANSSLQSALDSLTACYNLRSQETVEKVHGSLDTLKVVQQQQAALGSGTTGAGGHRSRILSVPNRDLLVKSPEAGRGFRSRSAMASKEPTLLESSCGGNDADAPAADLPKPADSCKFGALCPVEFVFNIEKQLALKRVLGNRVVKLNQMTAGQLQSEKLELQKNLLRYEHWFGRPVTRLEFSLVGHLYERYRAVKVIKQRNRG